MGHNLSLRHAPCAVMEDVDPRYPYERGAIGVRGYDVRDGSLVNPVLADLMAYCRPRWISDYHFTKAAEHRLRASASVVPGVAGRTRTLLLWGRVEDGRPILDPSFVVDAVPHLPLKGGPYRLEGRASSGEVLFSLGFDMPLLPDGDPGDRGFVFTLPVSGGWETLARITLGGPEGTVALDREGERSMGLLLDEFSGEVRGFLRDLPAADGAAAMDPPEPGLRLQVSRGVPVRETWERR
ncbi:hypothetical protein [Candidatus Palauibacter sp.]|uniref:hypothetical protein n=1 Tax=Candidatus Palauibacter sp. TaxID=3101350 RepID=UPI003AF2E9A2